MPNAKVLEKKKQVVADLAEQMKEAVTGVLVDYRGLTVEQDTALRKKLREANVRYSVVKNTLTRFAIKEIGLEDLDPILNGPTSLATSKEDMIAPARILADYAKTNDKLEIKAGFIEGKVVGASEIKALAALPPKEVLVARVLGGLNAPISGLVNVLNGNIRGLVVALNAIAEQKA